MTAGLPALNVAAGRRSAEESVATASGIGVDASAVLLQFGYCW
jgi:hypothetical protein